MPRELHTDVITALESDHIEWIVLCEMVFDAVTLRFCNRLTSIDYDSETYSGLGTIGSVGSIEENKDLDPTECTITISGTDPTVLTTFTNNDHLNRKIKIYYAILDAGSQIVGEPILHFDGSMDEINIRYGKEAIIEINVRDRLADWDRKQAERWTHEEQQALYPGDLGFEFVAELPNKKIIWGA